LDCAPFYNINSLDAAILIKKLPLKKFNFFGNLELFCAFRLIIYDVISIGKTER